MWKIPGLTIVRLIQSKLPQVVPWVFFTSVILLVVIPPAKSEEISSSKVDSSAASTDKQSSSTQRSPLITFVQKSQPVQPITKIPHVNEIEHPFTSAKLLVQSPVTPTTPTREIVQVTNVKANRTSKGVELILQTIKGQQLPVTNRSSGNNFIVDLPNAQLRLPSGQAFTFVSNKPIKGITQIRVNNLDASTIRVTVLGEARAPAVELFYSPSEGLIFSFASSTPATQQGQQPQTPPPPQAAKPVRPLGQHSPSTPANQATPEVVVTGEKPNGYSVPDASTATRTDTPIRDIPASIQVVPQQVIKDQQATSLDQALENVSGVFLQGNVNGRSENFSIRGFGTNNSPATILRDGFRVYNADLQGFPEIANLQSVEVLKGPASILYGDIEPGGVINLVSKKPLSQPFYGAELQVGSRALVRPSFDITSPLTTDNSLLYRLNGLYQHQESFRDFTTDLNRFFIAPIISWKIDRNTDISFSLDYTHDKSPVDNGLPALGDRVAPVPYTRIVTGFPDDVITRETLSTGYNLEHRFSRNWILRNAFRYINNNYYYNVIGFPSDISNTGLESLTFATQNGIERSYSVQTNLEGKFNTGSIRHTILFGVDFNKSDQYFVTDGNFSKTFSINIFNPVYPAKPNAATLPFAVGNEENDHRVGIYLQDQVRLLPSLIFLAGLRYDTITQTTITVPGTLGSAGNTTQDSDAVTPRVGLIYQPIKPLSLYASYSQSFTPNTGRTLSGNPLEPERGEGYEVGVKSELLRSKLFATLAYFDITKSNVSEPDPTNSLFAVTVGQQHSNGVELDISGEILPGWNVIANYAYINAKVTSDANAAEVGSRLPGIPFNSAGLWTTYQLKTGSLKGWGLGFGFNFVGERSGGLPSSFHVASYFVPNAAIFYQRDQLRFAVNFKNLSNSHYIQSTSNLRSVNNLPGEPLTVVGSVSLSF